MLSTSPSFSYNNCLSAKWHILGRHCNWKCGYWQENLPVGTYGVFDCYVYEIMMNYIISMFEYAATDEPTTVKQIRKRGSRWLNVKSPGTVFSQCSPTIWLIACSGSTTYILSKRKQNLGVDKMEALTLLGIMLLSGYSRLPYSRLY